MVTYLHLQERTVEVDQNIVEEIAANTTTDEISNAVSDVPERKPEEDAPPDHEEKKEGCFTSCSSSRLSLSSFVSRCSSLWRSSSQQLLAITWW